MPKKKQADSAPGKKQGRNPEAVEARKKKFVTAYLKNGGNALQAAISAGFSARTARVPSHRLIHDPDVIARINAEQARIERITGLDLERTIREVARVSYSDPRRMYTPVLAEDGNPMLDGQGRPLYRLMEPWEMDDDTAATVASVEVDEIKADGVAIGKTTKIKHWDKNAALEKAMKFHGLYREDNRQRGDAAIIALLEIVGQSASKFQVTP